MYVCLCRGITETEIRSAMENGSRTLEALQDGLGVATCCGCCRSYAEDMLRSFRSSPGMHDEPRWQGAVAC